MYFGQVQLCMAILNVVECDLVVYCSFDDSLIKVRFPFDEAWTRDFIFTLKNVYFNHMLHTLCGKE